MSGGICLLIRYQTFPKSLPTPHGVNLVVGALKVVEAQIDSSKHQHASNTVLEIARPHLVESGFEVEAGKTNDAKILRPVLFGEGGKVDKSFEADGFHAETGTVVEIEAGRGVTNYQFLKDLFQACVMQDAQHLVIAVRNTYRASNDYEKVVNFFDTLYSSGRLALPLESVTAVGY